ncbi:hypothetical protein OUZ56_002532 [Daphnia magna]|uniref:Uncharacterized protein n=1 Tax=Daphnia magna TaxID=35525 RepID=A0ABR0A5Y4_9CRUS|nr:hypothetical protein OUZ56_002532 [Daphnia magna]
MQSCSRRNMAWFCYHVFHLRLWDLSDVLWWPQSHSMTWFNPGLGFFNSEILEAPDVFHWCWSHSVTEENATMIALEVKWNKENNLFTDVSPTVKSNEISTIEMVGLRVK